MYPTIHAALICYFTALVLLLAARRDGVARVAYSLGLALLVAHVLLAYHGFHGWSQAHVLAHTAGQTFAVAGVRTSVGVYVNYAVMAVWLADVVWWWRSGAGAYRRRGRGVTVAVHAFLLFVTFNATVVFASGVVSWVGVGAFAVLAGLVARVALRGSTATPVESESRGAG
ncbi:MAG TPA: hypothetical protein VEA69_05135 [Tepidisphaeraceae bacterium]|nr:hypothetical protein [Tepidisphaeraceae bacterium]